MKRHPSLTFIIEVSVSEVDKLIELYYSSLDNPVKVIIVNNNHAMAVRRAINANGENGYRMGKLSDAAIFTLEEANEVLANYTARNHGALKLRPMQQSAVYDSAIELINEALEDCIDLHNKNNRVG